MGSWPLGGSGAQAIQLRGKDRLGKITKRGDTYLRGCSPGSAFQLNAALVEH